MVKMVKKITLSKRCVASKKPISWKNIKHELNKWDSYHIVN